ncbi:amidohydrolase family protein [Sphingobium sp. KCTC 72723]|uniref:amidohydrolase family protein n=1 Tax=Sphingobium sp. KCTC 72723 TaxID=2733867 RepID=UPI00292D6BB6|nr:amidohydrolase family protein [Sphingobium sp. KCTC 72723]
MDIGLLFRNAQVDGARVDVRVERGRIGAIGQLAARPGERVIEADGGALLPGLHDHHIHGAALAVARSSVACGPPDVVDADGLAVALGQPGTGWLRGVGYHESVAGMLDVAMLDRWAHDRPVRVQHRSGRMWFLNSLAMDLLLRNTAPPPGLDRATGQLFDADLWLRQTLGSVPPDLSDIGRDLARMGVTGMTDMSPANDGVMAGHFAAQRDGGRLPQRVVMAGTIGLSDAPVPGVTVGPVKLHLHENALPDFDACVAFVVHGHGLGRATAVHCTTQTELVFALAVLREAGAVAGDRIEHAGVAPDILVEQIAEMGLHVVSQPHFIAERGDRYLADVEPQDRPFLYRLGGFARAGVVLAAGSDAPYGSADPWAAMRAAVARRTAAGVTIGADEALSPEAARDLFLADPMDLTQLRRVTVGVPADLCLLSCSWAQARERLDADDVRMTIVGGSVVHDRVDQPPVQRSPGADPAA